MSGTCQVFGIRHHGPGSAKRLKHALEAYEPDIILIEGPEEATELIEYIRDPDLVPPVALLIYSPQDFEQVSYYPFAEFSPEWQAMKYGMEVEIPVNYVICFLIIIGFNLNVLLMTNGWRLEANLSKVV